MNRELKGLNFFGNGSIQIASMASTFNTRGYVVVQIYHTESALFFLRSHTGIEFSETEHRFTIMHKYGKF